MILPIMWGDGTRTICEQSVATLSPRTPGEIANRSGDIWLTDDSALMYGDALLTPAQADKAETFGWERVRELDDRVIVRRRDDDPHRRVRP